MPEFHLHMVSDSTGETVASMVRSALAQFDDIEIEQHTWPLVRTKGQMERAIEHIREHPGLVLYTVVDRDMQAMLLNACRTMRIQCVPALERVTHELSRFLGVKAHATPGRQYALDEEYFARVDAINFALAHDDGQNTEGLEDADIVLIGVSRTSKTPTCVYLSYRGVNVGNIPYVRGVALPDNVLALKKPMVVGLVIAPERLVQIRKSRLMSLKEMRETTYVDIEFVKEEVQEARRLFTRQQWPVIDVTRKSVEETAAVIMQYYEERKERVRGNE